MKGLQRGDTGNLDYGSHGSGWGLWVEVQRLRAEILNQGCDGRRRGGCCSDDWCRSLSEGINVSSTEDVVLIEAILWVIFGLDRVNGKSKMETTIRVLDLFGLGVM